MDAQHNTEGNCKENKFLSNQNSVSEQEEKDNIIKRQLRFQELLISISTTYINSDLSDIDGLIKTSLKQIGEFVESDRSYIFSYDFVSNSTSNTYEWCADGISPEIHNLQNVPVDYIPQWLNAHKKGEAFYVEDVSLLPDDGEHGLRAILEPQGIKSLITIPKIKNNELIGFIGFDAVKTLNKYTENEKEVLFVFAGMLVNVIQRKEHEEQIKAQEQKKEELLISLSNQNEQLNEYAQVVSHDLKSPLNNIHTLISWFKNDRREILKDADLEHLNLVLFNVEKMDFLIKGILDYSTADQLEVQQDKIDLNFVVKEVVQTMHVPKHIKIEIDCKLPIVQGNVWRFKQVFQNLIQNAIKYNNKPLGYISIGVVDKTNHFEFYVKDNGVGIKPDYFERIFKVFTKLDNDSISSGVGLSIVKKIIHFYKGKIWLESTEGVGTTFYFTLLK